jgi:hemerythrin superfamily protein
LFIVNLHAKIEDDILFPAYREAYKNDTEIIYLVDRISRDHELLKTLGNNVIKYGESGESELYKRRLERYLYILIDHNTSEEKLLFPLWDDINGEIRLQADKEAVELVEKYGYQEYTRIIRMMGKNI